MKKHIQNRLLKKAFTTIEIIIIVSVLAILAGLTLPKFVGVTTSATTSTGEANVSRANAQLDAYVAAGGNLAETDNTKFDPDGGVLVAPNGMNFSLHPIPEGVSYNTTTQRFEVE